MDSDSLRWHSQDTRIGENLDNYISRLSVIEVKYPSLAHLFTFLPTVGDNKKSLAYTL